MVVASEPNEERADEKSLSKNRDQSAVQESRSQDLQNGEEEEEIQLESRISKALTERTNQIVIILVLVLLFVLPFFQDSQYFKVTSSMDNGLKFVIDAYDSGNWNMFLAARQVYIDQNTGTNYPLIYLLTPDIN